MKFTIYRTVEVRVSIDIDAEDIVEAATVCNSLNEHDILKPVKAQSRDYCIDYISINTDQDCVYATI